MASHARGLLLEPGQASGTIDRRLAERLAEFMTAERDETATVCQSRNDALIAVRAAALRRTYESKIQRAEGTLATVELSGRDERVRRLHQGRFPNLQIALEASLNDVESR